MVSGLILPIMSHYLKNHLGFSPFQVGLVLAMLPIAAIIAPFILAPFDTYRIRAERHLVIYQGIAGILMLILSRQDNFYVFLLLYLLYGIVFMPTFSLTNTVAFSHLADAERDFGKIRMWGPISWVFVGWAFSMLWLHGSPEEAASRLGHALVFSSLCSFALAAFALTLPKSPDLKIQKDTVSTQWRHLRLFHAPDLVLLSILTFVNGIVHQFYYYGMGPFLSQLGFSDRYIMPTMSLGQLGEVFMLASLGYFMTRFGVKWTLVIGSFAQAARCVAFATGSIPLTLLCIPSHGICYAFFFTVGYIYVDRQSPLSERSKAQQFFNILILGLGSLFGNLGAGKTAEIFMHSGTTEINFTAFWLVPAILGFIITFMLALFFREARSPKTFVSE